MSEETLDDFFILTGFSDELTPQGELKKRWEEGGEDRFKVVKEDLETQIESFREFGINAIDLRNVGGVNVANLRNDEAIDIASELKKVPMIISCFGSPDGKIDIQDDLQKHATQFLRLVYLAELFNSQEVFPEMRIRMFSYWNEGYKGSPPLSLEQHRKLAINELSRRTEYAEKHGVQLLHENEKGIYGTTPERCVDLFKSVDSPAFRGIIDPANFVEVQYKEGVPQFDLVKSYEGLILWVEYIHMKDWNREKNIAVIAGTGDGYVRELLRMFYTQKKGPRYVSLEPHLTEALASLGKTDKELYAENVRAVKHIIHEVTQGR